MTDERIREIAEDSLEKVTRRHNGDIMYLAKCSSVERAIRTALAEQERELPFPTSSAAWQILAQATEDAFKKENRIRAEVWREAARMAREEEGLRKGTIVGAQFGFFACELEEKAEELENPGSFGSPE